MKRDGLLSYLLLFLSLVLGGVSVLFTLAFLNDTKMNCPLWVGLVGIPCFCAALAAVGTALSCLFLYLAHRLRRDLIAFSISGISALVMCVCLLLWMTYPFSWPFPMP